MEPFLGEIRAFGFNYAPSGWALCQGQLLSIRQNTALFSLLGTNYGGDGSSTFGLPDLRGRAALQAGQGPGLNPYTLGETGGAASVTLMQVQLPSHTHTLEAASDPAESAAPGGNILARAIGGPVYTAGPATVLLSPSATDVQGANQPHNNLPPYLVLNFCIALQGIFPQRP